MRIDPHDDRAMLAALPPRRTARPWLQLLNTVLALAGKRAVLVSHAEAPWASITFSGSRHTLVLAFEGDGAADAGEAFIDALPEHEFAIPRKLVADAAITRVDQTLLPEPRLQVEAELLLLDDA